MPRSPSQGSGQPPRQMHAIRLVRTRDTTLGTLAPHRRGCRVRRQRPEIEAEEKQSGEVIVWIKEEGGTVRRFVDRWTPSFVGYVAGEPAIPDDGEGNRALRRRFIDRQEV